MTPCARQAEDAAEEEAAVDAAVLRLLRGVALLPPPEAQQLLLGWISVSQIHRDPVLVPEL